jgi:hypothetical protein
MDGQNSVAAEQSDQMRFAPVQMVDPNREIDQDHAGSVCLRRTGSNCGSLPPNLASCRALSRSTSALNPSRTNAVFSFGPLTRCASARCRRLLPACARSVPESCSWARIGLCRPRTDRTTHALKQLQGMPGLAVLIQTVAVLLKRIV